MPESDSAHRVDEALEGEIVEEAVKQRRDNAAVTFGADHDEHGAERHGGVVAALLDGLLHDLALQGLVDAVGAVALGHISLRRSGEGGAPPSPCRSLVVYRLE